MKKNISNILKFLIFVGIGVGILYLVYANQNAAYQEECALKGLENCSLIDKVLEDFRTANYFWILLVVVAYTTSNLSRAARWIMLIRPLGYQPRFVNSFFSVMLGYFANLGFPRIGEFVRAGTMARYEKIGAEKLMGTIVVGRIIDVISILTLTALCFVLEFDLIIEPVQNLLNSGEAGEKTDFSYIWWALGLIAVALGAFLYFFRTQIMQSKFFQKILDIVKGFWQGLISIKDLDKPWLFILHSINIWFMYFMMTYLCFFAFEPTTQLPAIAALLTFIFGGWGIVVPSPGGMGTYHFLVVLTLGLYGISGDDAFSYANISFFAINLGANVLLGIMALIILPIVNKSEVRSQKSEVRL